MLVKELLKELSELNPEAEIKFADTPDVSLVILSVYKDDKNEDLIWFDIGDENAER